MKYQQNQHFSHHHVLNPLKLEKGDKIHCSACEEHITEPFHGCTKCNYFLHDNCLNTPRSFLHPSHPSHPLTLHPNPTYSSRSYTCDACNSSGNGFSLSCAICEFDIHLQCANLKNSVLIDKHPHELRLLFGSPYADKTTGYICDVCHAGMDPDRWLYYCGGCDFASHLDCVDSKPRPKATENVNRGASYHHQVHQGYRPSVEDIEAMNKAEEAIAAAQAQAMIAARGRQAALDLLDDRPKRYYYY